MALLDGLMNLFQQVMPVSTGAAMDRYTHTPIMQEPTHDPGWFAKYNPATTPLQAMTDQHIGWPTVGRTGFDYMKPGMIETQPDMPGYGPHILRHEIVHAITTPELGTDSPLRKKIGQIIPQEVQKATQDLYENIPDADTVKENVARFLTHPEYSDQKYNDAKLKLINIFSPATRGKITRMLGVQ